MGKGDGIAKINKIFYLLMFSEGCTDCKVAKQQVCIRNLLGLYL